MDADIDDTHLCIKCRETIVGLEDYIRHRKQNCNKNSAVTNTVKRVTSASTDPTQHRPTEETPAISYEPFSFNEPEPPIASSHGGKTSKNLGDNYDLAYELGADVFFSSLQLQSVQSSVSHHVPSQTGGKTGTSSQAPQLQRQKSLQQDQTTHSPESWIGNQTAGNSQHGSDKLLKAVNDMGETKKSYETIFKPLTFEHESPDLSDDDDEDDVEVDIDDDDDEDYDPIADGHATGGKWKLPLVTNSPPVVPVSHTGGKWKPEHRPNLRITPSQVSILSPNWDDHMDDIETNEGQHPPSDHTKGKWVPGTKLQRLEYKEVVGLGKLTTNQDYWCNICCRKLKSKTIYENHLKTSYHLKRSEPETQLEKAVLKEMSKDDINKIFVLEAIKLQPVTASNNRKKRKRRLTYLKCSLCKHTMSRHFIGKHLISHYHYRRMQMHPALSLHMILENIHSIVLQSPFQCRPCRFYANTEEMFLLHWNSASHLDASEGPGRFWCSFCQFECEDNNQMRRHLSGPEHKEVLLAINRSVPICISKRLSIDCPKCGSGFRYNFQLAVHLRQQHPSASITSTASDTYQSKFRCLVCPEVLPSKIALQRHEKFKHSISKYFCSICCMEFASPCQARRHRKTLDHKQRAAGVEVKDNKEKKEKFKKVSIEERISVPTRIENTTPVCKAAIKVDIPQNEQPCTSQEAKRRCLPPKPIKVHKTVKCIDCQQVFKSREDLKDHREKEHSLSQCMSCGENFVTAQELGQHSRKCKPTAASKDDETTAVSEAVKKRKTDSDALRKCDLCDFKAPYESEILYHRIFHSHGNVGKNQLIKCPLCEKSFRKHSLRCHLRQHTNEKIFKCNICDAAFSRAYNLKDHMSKLHGNKPKLTDAGNTAKKPVKRKDIKDTVVAKKTFQCDTCEKVFRSKHSLKMHGLTQHVATPDRRFVCPHENCEYGTVNNSLLKVHLASHSIESFKCSQEGCHYIGKSELHLKRHHQQSHVIPFDGKLFKCDQCKFKTKIKGHLQRHMRCHTGEKPYKCPHCAFRTNVSENLRKHILKTGKHPGKFVYECKLCETEIKGNKDTKILEVFKTNSNSEYQKHLATTHKKHSDVSGSPAETNTSVVVKTEIGET